MEHENRDPLTGACVDCGATREALDDNLFPICHKVHGPYKHGIIVLRQAARQVQWLAESARSAMERHEAMAVHCQREARELDARKREINAALAALGDAPPLILQGRD